MAPTTSPAATGEQRKFINPTPGYIGANIFGPDGKPTSIAVEPGGEVWLTEAEERMTAEAPRLSEHNPFIMEWEEPVEFDGNNEPTRTVTRRGTLVLSEEPPRPVASDRFIPQRGSIEDLGVTREAMEGLSAETEPEPQPDRPDGDRTVTGADVPPNQPPVQGQPSEDEIVGSPDAPAKNNEALAQREPTAEQPTRTAPAPGPLPIDD